MTVEELTVARNHTRTFWTARANEKDHKNMHKKYAFYYEKKPIELLNKNSIVKLI